MLDRENAQKFSKELKIDLFTVYREYLQLLFLKHFYNKKQSSRIYFKGGTAIRFIFGSFRFSEDLDFSAASGKDTLKELVSDTIKDLKSEGEELRFKKTKTLDDSFGGRLFRELENHSIPLTIKLDFSIREKPIEAETSVVETIFPIVPYPIVSHLSAREILAEKIRAFMTRTQGRDIFDIWFLLSKNIQMDKNIIDKKMGIYNKHFEIEEFISLLKDFPDKDLKRDLVKFLPLGHRNMVETIKDLLLKKLINIKE
jgi:predicted nucleotidyltransferase component of viral defense system